MCFQIGKTYSEEMHLHWSRAGLKKDLRVCRVGPRGSLNTFLFLHFDSDHGVTDTGPAGPLVRFDQVQPHLLLPSSDGARLPAALNGEQRLPKGSRPWEWMQGTKTILPVSSIVEEGHGVAGDESTSGRRLWLPRAFLLLAAPE
ncbi:hypothetical protein D1007_61039 [Hordeum vulgare]|nr:hypothetical protein D1007_61039 [Hordeum vulgare]